MVCLKFRQLNISPPPKYGGKTTKNAFTRGQIVNAHKPNFSVISIGAKISVGNFHLTPSPNIISVLHSSYTYLRGHEAAPENSAENVLAIDICVNVNLI